MRGRIIEGVVGADHHREDVVEAERRCDIEPVIRFEAHPDGVRDGGIAGDRLIGRGERRVRRAEALPQPQMYPRLVAHPDRPDGACGRLIGPVWARWTTRSSLIPPTQEGRSREANSARTKMPTIVIASTWRGEAPRRRSASGIASAVIGAVAVGSVSVSSRSTATMA